MSVADIEDDRIRKVVSDLGATAVAADDVYGIDADIFSPCPPGCRDQRIGYGSISSRVPPTTGWPKRGTAEHFTRETSCTRGTT